MLFRSLYTFRQVNALAVTDEARRFMRALTRFDGELIQRGVIRAGQPVNAPLLTALRRETEGGPLDWKDVWLRGLELCAGAMGQRVDAVYDAPAMIRRFREFCAAQEFPEKFDEAGLQAVARRGGRALMAFCWQRLAGGEGFPPELFRLLGESPAEVAGAMFLNL